MDKNRIVGASIGRAGDLPRSPYPSRVPRVDPATVHGRRLNLPQEICAASPRRLRPSRGGRKGIASSARWARSKAGVSVRCWRTSTCITSSTSGPIDGVSGRHTRDVVVVRFADDFVVGFEYRDDAERLLADLRERFARFGLSLHPEKTRLIEFGRFAAANRRARGEGRRASTSWASRTAVPQPGRAALRFCGERCARDSRRS